jgi:hypothetical protein
MKAVAGLLLFLSLPGARLAPPLRSPVEQVVTIPTHKGRWYFAETGHAVYCVGPVMMVPQPRGGIQRVATFCRGNKLMVPLKD